MAHELTRRDALAQVSSFVSLGTQFENIADGQETFQGGLGRSGGCAEPARDATPATLAARRSAPGARQLAVEVPGMSVPQVGCDEIALNPVLARPA